MRRRLRINLLLIVGSLCAPCFSQTPTPVSDPQAVALATKAISTLSGSTKIVDATLTGAATWTSGSDVETGTITLKLLGTGESRLDLALTGGTRSEIRDLSTGVPLGEWIDNQGVGHRFSFHNCLTDASWFFPALTSLNLGPTTVLSYAGQVTTGSVSLQHIQSYVFASNGPGAKLSAMDFYLDSSTLLPTALLFNVHSDSDQNTDIPVGIYFSSYQAINGIMVPTHIQKFLNGSLFLDIVISGVAVNTGLTSAAFAIN